MNGNCGSQNNVYIGARYVPRILGEWSADMTYEPLDVVLYQGTSYTSRTYVPKGIIPGESTQKYWALTGNYNVQVEMYRQEVVHLKTKVDEFDEDLTNLKDLVTNTFTNVNEMKKGNLVENMYAQTLGYYSINDGGNGLYIIVPLDEEKIDNGAFIKINDNLMAKLIYKDHIMLKQYGAYGDGTHDDTQQTQLAINYCMNNNVMLLVNVGEYYISETLTINKRISIKGVIEPNLFTSTPTPIFSFNSSDPKKSMLYITTASSGYDWGNASYRVNNVNLENLTFTGLNTNNSRLCMWCSSYLSTFKNIHIMYFDIGIAVARSYETIFDTVRITNCKKCFVARQSAPEILLKNCWFTFNASIKNAPDSKIVNSETLNFLKQAYPNISEYYSCLSLYNSEKWHIENCAFEASCIAIDSDSTDIYGVNLNFELFTKYLFNLYQTTTLKNSVTLINTNIFQGDNTWPSIPISNQNPNTILTIDVPNMLPSKIQDSINNGYCSCDLYSKSQGHKISGSTIIAPSTANIINKSHYNGNEYVIDIDIRDLSKLTEETTIEINAPHSYNSLNINHILFISSNNQPKCISLRRNSENSNWILKNADNTNISLDDLKLLKGRIVFEYKMNT